MLKTIRDVDNGLEYEIGKIYVFDTFDKAWDICSLVKKEIGLDIITFTNKNRDKFYIQIKPIFENIFDEHIAISLPNIIPEKKIENTATPASFQNSTVPMPFEEDNEIIEDLIEEKDHSNQMY